MDFSADIKKLPTEIRRRYTLIELCDTPEGLLIQVGNLLDSLDRNSKTKDIFRRFRSQIVNECNELQEAKVALVNWLREKLVILRGLRCSRSPAVIAALDSVEKALSGTEFIVEFNGGYFSHLCSEFSHACGAVAYYGNCAELKGWLDITSTVQSITFNEPFGHDREDREVSVWSPEGAVLTAGFGHGFSKATVYRRVRDFDGPLVKAYSIETGGLCGIHYPDSYYRIFPSARGSEVTVQVDIDGAVMLDELSMLSSMRGYDPQPLSKLKSPTSLVEADRLCNDQLVQYFLSGFSGAQWDKSPLSKADILSKVQRFLILLLSEINCSRSDKRRVSPKERENTRKVIAEAIDEEYRRLRDLGRIPNSYGPMRTAALKALEKQKCKGGSDRLVRAELQSFSDRKGFVPKRGRAEAQKE